LLSMDISKWFRSTSDHRCALGRHKASAAARALIEHQDHVGCCCRIALRAARRPPRAQAAFRTSSNSGVQRQVLPLGLPYFCPFMGPPSVSLRRSDLDTEPSICQQRDRGSAATRHRRQNRPLYIYRGTISRKTDTLGPIDLLRICKNSLASAGGLRAALSWPGARSVLNRAVLENYLERHIVLRVLVLYNLGNRLRLGRGH
jgi:hypothetical protein